MKNILLISCKGDITPIKKFISDQGYHGTECASFIQSENFCRKQHVDLVICELEVSGQSAIDYFNSYYKVYAKDNYALPIIFYDGKNFTRQMQDNIITSLEY